MLFVKELGQGITRIRYVLLHRAQIVTDLTLIRLYCGHKPSVLTTVKDAE